jgi:malate/lactate dehydrogenase
VAGWSAEREQPIATEVRTAAYEIIKRKGATNHAIGLTTAALLRSGAARRAARAHRVARADGRARAPRRRALTADRRRRDGAVDVIRRR